MTRILYCGYFDREAAERAFGELLEEGVAAEDMSLVAKALASAKIEERRARRMVDSGQVHPEELRNCPGRLQGEGLPGLESAIGAGISTNTFNDDVSAIEEMDDAPSVAEEVAEPISGQWYGMEELQDAERFAALGTIDATRPSSPGFGTARASAAKPRAERPFSNNVVGRMLILGDGALATGVLASRLVDAKVGPTQTLKDNLFRNGVGLSTIIALADIFDAGGAVLAVTEAPGRIPIHRLEAVVESTGAEHMRAFNVKSS